MRTYGYYTKMNVYRALDIYLATLENSTTRTNYEIVLRDFLANIRKVEDITEASIVEFKNSMADKAAQTITARLAAIRSFCDFCWTQGWIPSDPSLGVKNVQVERYGQAKNISFEDLKKFLGAIDTNTLKGMRDYLLLRLAFMFGDVKKILQLPWDVKLPESLDVARARYESLLSQEKNLAYFQNGYLFFNVDTCDNSKALSLSSARKIVIKYVRDAGFPEKYIDFQALKRLRAKQIFTQTNSIEAVMKFCGHRSIKATKAFLKTL